MKVISRYFQVWCALQHGQRTSVKELLHNNLGFGIFEKVDKDLGLGQGTAWAALGWKDYCDFGFGDI